MVHNIYSNHYSMIQNEKKSVETQKTNGISFLLSLLFSYPFSLLFYFFGLILFIYLFILFQFLRLFLSLFFFIYLFSFLLFLACYFFICICLYFTLRFQTPVSPFYFLIVFIVFHFFKVFVSIFYSISILFFLNWKRIFKKINIVSLFINVLSIFLIFILKLLLPIQNF